jgi:hypothetical protein
MNANELADEIKTMLADSESYYGNAEGYLIKAEAMLRQQQTEIEALNSIKYVNGTTIAKLYAEIEALKAKTLTDMEILEIANKFKNLEWAIVAFARAILKKASEK